MTANRVAVTPASMMKIRAIKVIGLGGIGSFVAPAIAHFVFAGRLESTLWLLDGDDYEEKNKDRVLFESAGNKALEKAKELSQGFDHRIKVIGVPEYVTPRNVRRVVDGGDVVFLCVDNHASRKLVSNRCRRLDDVVLFSGGNDGIENGRDGTFGNAQIYVRSGGCDITNPLTRLHPEIAKPKDKRPDELGCADLINSAPQLLFTNMAVASAMLSAFFSWHHGTLDYEEIYLDIAQSRMIPVKRAATIP
jgi:hypothetical protein